MKCLLTTVRTSQGGGESRTSREIDSAALTIGRGTDQHVHVPDFHVALQHARLVAVGPGDYQLEVLSANGIVVNGRRQQGCRLAAGDRIKLGATQITIEAAPSGFDLALAVCRTKLPADGLDRFPHSAVLANGPAIRLMSWILFLSVLAAGLGFPLVSHFKPETKPGLAALSLPGTSIWLPGPLTAAHEYFGHDCTTCHQQPFQPVADASCKTCHADVSGHLPLSIEGVTDPAAQRCESCHMEHNGAAQLINSSQAFCADCHLDTSDFTGLGPSTPAAIDFADEHPPFKVNLFRTIAQDSVDTLRLPLADARTSEQSNLLFPHDVHLDSAGVDAPQGNVVMQCQDCHQPDEGGSLMLPISFQAHCNSCHQLAFDLSAPDREVPHGDPTAALNVLTEFYSQLALRGSSDEVPIEILASATPDESLRWARIQAGIAATALFEDRACMQCHEVSRSESDNSVTWTVSPVHLNQSWFPAAGFDHASHLVTECDDCHQARGSNISNDVLMPDINTCRDCHGGEGASRSLASTCISCHRFHSPARMKPDIATTPSTGTLILRELPDLEQKGRDIRGIDPRRKRPGEDS